VSGDLNNTSVSGLLAFCEWLTDKSYATTTQVNPWKIAVRKVFETVEGENYEALDLASIDLEEYLARFQIAAGAQYKAESIAAYKRRIVNALEAHRHYLRTGRPPSFRQGPRRTKAEDKGKDSGSVVKLDSKSGSSEGNATPPSPGLHPFTWPLSDGRVVTLHLPPRMKADDVTRLCTLVRSLQDDSPEPRQIPRRTGENDEESAAA
jgi:hypothetical protein